MRPAWRIVDRLIARAVLAAVLLTWFVLAGFDAMLILVGELDDVGKGSYTFAKAVSYTLLTMPRRLYETFGHAALIGSVRPRHSPAAANGPPLRRLSKMRICLSAVLTLVVLVAGVVVGETFGPYGDQQAGARPAAKSKDIALARAQRVGATATRGGREGGAPCKPAGGR